jgi:hypothetical protein
MESLQRVSQRYIAYLVTQKRRNLVDEIGHLRSLIAELSEAEKLASSYISKALVGKEGVARGYELKATVLTYDRQSLNAVRIRNEMDTEWLDKYSVTTKVSSLKFSPL